MENVRVRHWMAGGFYCFKTMLCLEARGLLGQQEGQAVGWYGVQSDFRPQAQNSLRVAQTAQLKKPKNNKKQN